LPEDRLQLGEIEAELRDVLEVESKKIRPNIQQPPLFRRPAVPPMVDNGSIPIKRAQQG